MFKKKYSSKEDQSVGKSDIKKLRADVLDVIGKDNADKFDLIVGKKDTVSKRRCQCGSGGSAFVYSVNDVPFFVSVDRVGEEEQDVITQSNRFSFPMVPTVFFFLRMRQLLVDHGGVRVGSANGRVATVVCRGPTSRFLLSGAHLMMPGILSVEKRTPLVVGDVALVYSIGVDAPYAVGIVTGNMTAKQDTGVGVFVIQCFRDNLWQQFENRFVANYSLSSHVPLIPSEFGEDEVLESFPGASVDAAEPQALAGGASSVDAIGDGDAPAVNYAELFTDEDAVLTFCLCEAAKQVSKSLLPITLPQFTSIVVRSYPRDGVHTEAIQFKDTKHKKALAFFQRFPELLTISETSPGVHSVIVMNRSADVMRQHNARYADFLATVHQDGCDQEARALQAKLLADGTAVFRQNIVSTCVLYAVPRELDDDLARVLLMGEELNIPRDALFPTIEQVTTGTVPVYERVPVPDSVFQDLYQRRALVDNLKSYIKVHGLLVVTEAEKGKLPCVKIDDTLSLMFSSKTYAPELPLDQVERAMLSLFRVKYEIVLQTTVEGSTLATENLVPKRILKNGSPPKVNVWAEKATGNKYVTIVRNLEAFGLDLQLLSAQWKKQFSTSCSVVDPSTEMTNLKSGTKIPLEIHVQGSLQLKIEAALLKEVNLPPSQLVSKKG
ncbi:Translation initiation factor SUI1 [Novymonas esmeraldas]|uniref:Translation initiation factor SUI1 n=1 Tax=Novymonas esmeraldas TaxID=1808958 RepID=A0AAW0EQG0_9TRYP